MSQVSTRFIRDAAVTAAKIAPAAINNAKIADGAGITYDKLDLADSITNADVAADAAIAYSKLNLANRITNSDIQDNAAIAYTKLALAGSIQVVDLDAASLTETADPLTVVKRDADGHSAFVQITLQDAPTQPTHAATKAYVDAVRAGLDPKYSVRLASTANLLLDGEQTMDGGNALVGQRVLVKNQNDATTNGIYVVQPGPWVRADDADDDSKVTPGMFTLVEEGMQAGTGWVLLGPGPLTLGTSDLQFTPFSQAGQLTADGALSITNGVIRHGPSGLPAGTYNQVTTDLYGHVTGGLSTAYQRFSNTATNQQTQITLMPNVVSESESLVIDGVIQDKALGDYSIDYTTGVITLGVPLSLGETYVVTCEA